MKVVIHQPEYLPWLGFFDKINKCDLFVILDHVQFQRKFINRNRIKTTTGWQWLTTPIIHKYHRGPINQMKIDNETGDWRDRNWRSLTCNYARAPYFKEYAGFLKDAFERDWEFLADLNIYLIENLMQVLGLKVPTERSSLLNTSGKGTELLIEICKKVKADTYLSGPGGKNYMDLERFKQENIKVEFQEFEHPVYPQRFGDFIENLSIIDLLFNCGEKSFEIITGKNK